jgi:hypothetical protein
MIFGSPGSHAGVGEHIGHYGAHLTQMIQMGDDKRKGFMSGVKLRTWMQTAMALMLCGSYKEATSPCCEHDIIGGDGTCIGIPVSNIVDLRPIWDPPAGIVSRHGQQTMQRMDRCPLRCSDVGDNRKRLKQFRSLLKTVTSRKGLGTEKDLLTKLPQFNDLVSSVYLEEIARWLRLPRDCEESMYLKPLIAMLGSSDSITGAIPAVFFQELRKILIEAKQSKGKRKKENKQ